MKKNALKKTKKYQRVAKLQANIKGWLFRQRRERLLAKLNHKKEPEEDVFGDTGEFDAEAFFGIKEENLATNSAMTGINEDLMMKAIQIMTTQDPTAQAKMLNELKPSAVPIPTTQKPPKHSRNFNATAERLPDIASRINTNQGVDDKIKPKSFAMQNTAMALTQG